jgi:hypothetical protein
MSLRSEVEVLSWSPDYRTRAAARTSARSPHLPSRRPADRPASADRSLWSRQQCAGCSRRGQGGAQLAPRLEQGFVDGVPAGAQHVGRHGVERDRRECRALLAAQALPDGPAQPAEQAAPLAVPGQAGGSGNRSQSPRPSGKTRASRWRQPMLAESSRITNFDAQVMNQLRPRNPSRFAAIACSAAAAAGWTRPYAVGQLAGTKARASGLIPVGISPWL